jgi:thiamine biosynthesis lipoprotein
MGFPISIVTPHAGPPASAAIQEALEVLESAERRFSLHRADSEVSRYAAGHAQPGPDLTEVLALGERFRVLSGGAFDIHDGDRLDTDGVVKGWAAQRAADVLRARGIDDFCLNAGGDIVTGGEAEPGRPWRVAVRSPSDPAHMIATLDLNDGAVATSGTYERGPHIRDGRTGTAAQSLRSATAVGANLAIVDIVATTMMALGPDGVQWALGHGADLAFAVAADGTLYSGSAGGTLVG